VIEGLFAKIAAADYLSDLSSLSMDELRSLRSECQRVEDAVSYQRRLVQGRLDVLQAESDRRNAGAPPADLESLVASLPGDLAGGVAGPRRGHVAYEIEQADLEEVSTAVDAVVGPSQLAALPGLSTGELAELAEHLRVLERDVSSRRRLVFDRLDALADEVGRRYRDGEATVDSLLR
jgi:hypothetical protein